jgi:uncharacterized membrane protein
MSELQTLLDVALSEDATADEKAKAGRMALLASRTNTMLSIPMLYFMVAQSHHETLSVSGCLYICKWCFLFFA